MKLLASLASPYTRKVRVVLAEKKIEFEMELVDVAPAENPVNPHNPLGKIPTLVLDDGAALYDSRVIVEFLDHASPLNRLIPAEIRERVQVRRWEALADGVVDAGILVRGGFQLKPGDIDWPAEYPVLGRHYAKLMARPAFADTAPK
jgi:glutathione S-transferase